MGLTPAGCLSPQYEGICYTTLNLALKKKSNIPPVTESEMRAVISKQRNQKSLRFWPQTQKTGAQKDTANSEFKLLNLQKVRAFSPLLVSSK